MQRRNFFKSIAATGLGAALSPVIKSAPVYTADSVKPKTNIAEAMAVPRSTLSMPGKYPGRVVKVNNANAVVDGKPSEEEAYEMLKRCMLELTGEHDLSKAWLQFVGPDDVIGIKVNPVAGKLLTTSHAVTRSIVKQLEEACIHRSNMIIWDIMEMQLHETGYTEDNYPGIKIKGTECQDAQGGFINKDGKFYSEDRIDKKCYFFADVEGEYDAYTMPYMVNGGKNSYFTKICTEDVTKIINVPVLKNAGSAVTLCLKNLAFGAITNTGRLHQQLWHETCAYACAFSPLRDKVVLNIVDGLIGCFDGGPSANPQFMCNYNTLLVGSDPVAVDRIGDDIVIAKRIEEGIQVKDKPEAIRFMHLAEELKLGIADRNNISLTEFNV